MSTGNRSVGHAARDGTTWPQGHDRDPELRRDRTTRDSATGSVMEQKPGNAVGPSDWVRGGQSWFRCEAHQKTKTLDEAPIKGYAAPNLHPLAPPIHVPEGS